MKSKLRQDKGITLIALVITIIVLLILAGVTIAMLTGENGLLQRAADTNGSSAYSTACEQVKLAYANLKTEILTQKHSNPNYNAQANGESLAAMVGRDLNGEEWSTPTYNSTNKAIEITYTNSSLRAGMVSEGKPAQSGEINFSIGILAQDVTLSIDGVEEYGSSEPEPPVDLISFTIDGVTYHAEEGMDWETWINSDYNTQGFQIVTATSTKTGDVIELVGNSDAVSWSARLIQPFSDYIQRPDRGIMASADYGSDSSDHLLYLYF